MLRCMVQRLDREAAVRAKRGSQLGAARRMLDGVLLVMSFGSDSGEVRRRAWVRD